jgi:Domain of unknown function (DUF4148)
LFAIKQDLGGFIMFKSLIPAIVIASALAAPSFVFAQENAPVTRAQVKAELVQLEKAGYTPGAGDNASYPVQLQAAEARVAGQDEQSSYGGVAGGSSASGYRAPAQTGVGSTYFGR